MQQACALSKALDSPPQNVPFVKDITEESTTPVKTAEALERVVKASTGDHSFCSLSNPKFLVEGTATKTSKSSLRPHRRSDHSGRHSC